MSSWLDCWNPILGEERSQRWLVVEAGLVELVVEGATTRLLALLNPERWYGVTVGDPAPVWASGVDLAAGQLRISGPRSLKGSARAGVTPYMASRAKVETAIRVFTGCPPHGWASDANASDFYRCIGCFQGVFTTRTNLLDVFFMQKFRQSSSEFAWTVTAAFWRGRAIPSAAVAPPSAARR